MKNLNSLLLTFLVSFGLQAKTIQLTSKNTIAFDQEVSADFVAKKSLQFAKLNESLPSNEPIYLVMNTPGGSVTDGQNFINFLKGYNRKVITVTIFAASMGYQIVQNLDDRYMVPNATLMSHRAAIGGIGGQIPGELNSRIDWILDNLKETDLKAAARLGISLEEYRKQIQNELWLTSEKAVASKNADEIVNAVCSNELLNGRHIESLTYFIFKIEVEYSNCPMITTPISVKAGRELRGVDVNKIVRQMREAKRKVQLTL